VSRRPDKHEWQSAKSLALTLEEPSQAVRAWADHHARGNNAEYPVEKKFGESGPVYRLAPEAAASNTDEVRLEEYESHIDVVQIVDGRRETVATFWVSTTDSMNRETARPMAVAAREAVESQMKGGTP